MASEEVSSTHRQFVLFVDSHEQALLSAQRLRARQVLMNSLERRELVKCHGYIANLAPAKDRARLAQGTLQMLFEFQSQVARLYGCAVANASMYDAIWCVGIPALSPTTHGENYEQAVIA